MIYECPSCKLLSKDDVEPLERLSHPLCVFCSSKHTQKELLNWQMDHLKEIDPKHFPVVLRHFYKYVENQLTTLEERFNDQKEMEESFKKFSQCKQEDCGTDSALSPKEKRLTN